MNGQLILYYHNQWFVKHSGSLKFSRKNYNLDQNGVVADFLKTKLPLKKDEIYCILYSGYIDLDTKIVIDFLKNQKIKKIYFFIEDCLRVINSGDCPLQSYAIGTENYDIPELLIILDIIDQTSCEYEIFHCEYSSKIYEEKYKIKIKFFDWFLYKWITLSGRTSRNLTNNFTHKICCFNLRPDFHRYFIANLLSNEPDTFITLNHNYTLDRLRQNKALPLDKFSNDIKDTILKNSKNLNFEKLTWDADPKKILIDHGGVPDVGQHLNYSPIIDSFVCLVTETRFACPTVYITEKTLKPIEVFRPFIILGAPGSLAFLKKIGFKTFGDFWDESYDNITDHTRRFEEVYKITKHILNLPPDDLKRMLNKMQKILLHNNNHYCNSNFGEILFDLK